MQQVNIHILYHIIEPHSTVVQQVNIHMLYHIFQPHLIMTYKPFDRPVDEAYLFSSLSSSYTYVAIQDLDKMISTTAKRIPNFVKRQLIIQVN